VDRPLRDETAALSERVTAFPGTWPSTDVSRALSALRRTGTAHRYADNETNYCARCQTAARLLADRSLSRLLKADWPRTLEESMR